MIEFYSISIRIAARTIYRVSQTCCTILIRYMVLASLPEIAQPSSEMVVGYMCIETHFGVGENWPCECISVRSLHQIVTNHPNSLDRCIYIFHLSV